MTCSSLLQTADSYHVYCDLTLWPLVNFSYITVHYSSLPLAHNVLHSPSITWIVYFTSWGVIKLCHVRPTTPVVKRIIYYTILLLYLQFCFAFSTYRLVVYAHFSGWTGWVFPYKDHLLCISCLGCMYRRSQMYLIFIMIVVYCDYGHFLWTSSCMFYH